MKQEFLQVKENRGYYDSIAAGSPLRTSDEADTLLAEAAMYKINVLYILTEINGGGAYYKKESGKPIVPVLETQVKEEFFDYQPAPPPAVDLGAVEADSSQPVSAPPADAAAHAETEPAQVPEGESDPAPAGTAEQEKNERPMTWDDVIRFARENSAKLTITIE